ncbi:hypothetical protein RIF29_37873 [Crotalaria pallida]|uniref:Uncharacterized protein n=1 Tax=Crotalaria pallida TaxID=3830 RepID=A0AAN9HN94_CROPI
MELGHHSITLPFTFTSQSLSISSSTLLFSSSLLSSTVNLATLSLFTNYFSFLSFTLTPDSSEFKKLVLVCLGLCWSTLVLSYSCLEKLRSMCGKPSSL